MQLALMRPQKWAHGPMGELALVRIEVEPHAGQWMWSASLNSRNGSGQGYKALPKWGKFAPSSSGAVAQAAEEVRAFMHRATATEQKRITEWLAAILANNSNSTGAAGNEKPMYLGCQCGFSGDFDLFTRTPKGGDLPRNEYQCPKCFRAWRLETHGAGHWTPQGQYIPPDKVCIPILPRL